MRIKIALAALGLGLAGAVLPATSASAVCVDPGIGHCLPLCPHPPALGDDLPVGVHWYCLA